jgi:tRNA dimethylallyltransferase
VIAGPTAVGKTAVATALASLEKIEIVSADSRQVYRGLDIGTAKPTQGERAAAPYHGLDLIPPAERYSAGRFARDAGQWIKDIRARGRLPVVVGGTGFYLRALFEDCSTSPTWAPVASAPALGGLSPRNTAALGAAGPGFRGGGAARALRALEVALLPGTAVGAAADEAAGRLRSWTARLELRGPRPQNRASAR